MKLNNKNEVINRMNKRLSPSEQKQLNHQKFTIWMSTKTDDDYKQMIYRGRLSRKEIASECGFDKSALRQNPDIKGDLTDLENDLRKRGVLPEKIEKQEIDKLPERDIESKRNMFNTSRLSKLEQEVATLRAENNGLKEKLIEHELIDEILIDTGRIPR
ncbi:MAG: VPA1267 family protein [Pseudomonadota bacterium]